MLIPVDWLVPNPYRDFNRYPIDKEQVQVLLASIDGLSFWGGVTARPDPNGDKERFEIGGGHHRVEAYKLARVKNPKLDAQIEVCVDAYTDLQMAQIQAVENMTQRGTRAAAALDSIGGLYEVLAYTVLTGETLAQISERVSHDGKGYSIEAATLKGQLESGRGLGAPTFLEVLPVNCMSRETIEIALRSLKDGGLDEPIMARIQARITRETAEREAEERRKAEEAERQRIEAEERSKAAEEKAARDAEERERKEQERQRKEEERQAKLAEENERKAARKAERERQAEERKRERERKAAEKAELKRLSDEAKAAKKAEEAQRKALEAEEKRRKDAEAAHKAAEERPKTLDPRVAAQLGWSNYQIRRWNQAVTSKAAQTYIPVKQHFALAKAIDEKGRKLEEETSKLKGDKRFEMTAEWIKDQVQLAVEEAIGIQREATKAEKAQALRESTLKRVYEQFKAMRKACASLATAGRKLRDLKAEFAKKPDLGTFPYDGDTYRVLRETRDAINTILEQE